jgi:5-methylcytosine-specific restriction protein B
MDHKDDSGPTVAWFVGASFSGNNDQTQRFLAEGIWEVHNPNAKESALVRSMKPGDRIAIKAAYTRKHGLPFDNRGHTVAVFAIKAIGTVVGNPQDGERVSVKWKAGVPLREWYFYTYRPTIWRHQISDYWMSDELIAFAFDEKPQDIDRFCNAPYWLERFGTGAADKHRFIWTKFYEAIANALLLYRSNRPALVEGIQEISRSVDGLGYLAEDRYPDGTTGFIRDICPFTTIGMFNRGVTDANRKIIAGELAKFLGVGEPVPSTFEGIPLLNNLTSWYFPYEIDRADDHIDTLWDTFAKGMRFADSDEVKAREEFALAFDHANGRPGVAWNMTFGLYWTRPWAFLSLDNNSQLYISKKLGVPIDHNGPKKRCSSNDYLSVMDALEQHFQQPSYPVHSYPELSLEAWQYKDPTTPLNPVEPGGDDPHKAADETAPYVAPIVPYTVDDILKDGCFLVRATIDGLLDRLRTKKNVILQGPPGTGKTWLAKRLAFALMGQKDDSKLRAVQFHPNLSYEDFVRGWRPTGQGKLSLVDGVFMEAIKAAAKFPAAKVVVVIEEINRGNPAQIFGELLTLLEASKRTPSEALELCYPDADGVRRPVHIPENLYVIGTMNIADRSLALVDLALRRRFAFVGLEPILGPVWRNWVVERCGVDLSLAVKIEKKINGLNVQIEGDARLGKQFQIGHSYVTPAEKLEDGETLRWFEQVVATEIGPLLDEYWFDAPGESRKACSKLLEGW